MGIQIIPRPKLNPQDILDLGSQDDLRDSIYSDNDDSHNLMCQVGHGFFHKENAERMLEEGVTEDGSLYRFVPHGHKEPPSGDMLAAWCYFYIITGVKRPDLVKKVARHYVSNCMALLTKDGKYSARSSNSGVNFLTEDGWPLRLKFLFLKIPFGISQPTTGPAYCNTAAILSLARKELGWHWNIIYWFHYWTNNGWFHENIPYLHLKKEQYWFYYTAHVAQMSLYVISKCRGGRKFGLSWIAEKCAPSGNMQPFIAGMANDCGALSEENRKLALDTLMSQKPVWPQHMPLDDEYNSIDNIGTKNLYSMMALATYQLLKK